MSIPKKPIGYKPIRRRPSVPYKAKYRRAWYVWKFVKDLARYVSRLAQTNGKCRYCEHAIGCGCEIAPENKQIGGYCIIPILKAVWFGIIERYPRYWYWRVVERHVG
jgi:hypothetical protein